MEVTKPIVLRFNSDEEWLAERAKYIGASEIACLFGHGFTTYYQLWAEKSGIIPRENLDDVFTVACGEELEAGFAKVIQRFTPHKMRKSRRYLVYGDERYRLATSLDYEVLREDAGWVPAELKIIDWMSLADNWEETENAGEYEPPLKYSLQLQTQMLITGAPYGYIFALVGNRQMVEVRQEADRAIHDLILERVEDFWVRVREGLPPAPDYDKDLQAMLRVMTAVEDGREVHHHGDPWWEDRIQAYAMARDRANAAENIKKVLKAEILEAIGKAIRVKCTNGSITAKNTDRWGAPRRDLRITPAKGLSL